MDAAETLAKVPLFQSMSPEFLERLQRVARERTYQPGAEIIREGDFGIAFFVIASGHAEAIRGSGPDATVINRLGPGESFGELALLTEVPRMATIRAVDEVTCLAIARLDFIDALRDQPEIAISLLKTLAELLRKTEERASQATAR